MTADLAFFVSRIRGLRSHLLSRRLLRLMTEAPSPEAVIPLLADTAYGPYLAAARAVQDPAGVIEEAVRGHLSAVFELIDRLAGGRIAALAAPAVGPWEIRAVKGLLRGLHRGLPPEEILRGIVPAGRLTGPVLHHLIAMEDVGGVIATLRIWGFPYAAALSRARARSAGEDLQPIETALDRTFFETALAGLDGTDSDLTRFLRLQIDAANTATALRLAGTAKWETPADDYFIEGGVSPSRSRYRGLLRLGGPGEAAAAGAGTTPGRYLARALPAYRETGRVSTLEAALESMLFTESQRLARREPLGAGVAAGYVWLLGDEAAAVRLIARGAAAGMPRDELAANLARHTRGQVS